ncbi:MAG: hypothetical protein J7513_03330 [Solirubrobacteraceae bacterium]|nr:hypothetical protein [Solirubrobacteraceae bacterium]
MRSAAAFAVVAALVVLLVVRVVAGVGSGDDAATKLCDALENDLSLAVTAPKREPSSHDLPEISMGFCNVSIRRRLDVDLPGIDRHSDVVLAGYVETDPARRPADLVRLHGLFAADTRYRVSPLPSLGADAFLAVRRQAPTAIPGETPDPDPVRTSAAVNGDPSTVLELPVTAHWRHGTVLLTAAANRGDAARADARRMTIRLAELLSRHPSPEYDR